MQPNDTNHTDSPFRKILRDLIRRVPGVHGAALVDETGETVEFVGEDAFDTRVAAAHWQIVFSEISAFRPRVRTLTFRGAERSFVVRALPEEYCLVVLVRKRGFLIQSRAFAVCESSLSNEAGWQGGENSLWIPVDVERDERSRPTRILGSRPGTSRANGPLTVLGGLISEGSSEVGFQVRLASGEELTLVREPGGQWYATAHF